MIDRKRFRSAAKTIQSRNKVAKRVLHGLYTSVAMTEIARARLFFALGPKTATDFAPSFFCIGAQKAGTSWLDTVLRQHPDVDMPLNRKELHFFDSGFWKGQEWYAWNYRRGKSAIRGDVTPAYSALDLDRVRSMAAVNPDAKILFVLRDPVERAWSMAYMDLVTVPKRQLSEVPDQVFTTHFESSSSTSRGTYAKTIKNFTSVFGKASLEVLFYDDLCRDPVNFLRRVLCCIGADVARMPSTPLVNRRVNVGGVSVPDRFCSQLNRLYHEEKKALRHTLDKSNWPNWL